MTEEEIKERLKVGLKAIYEMELEVMTASEFDNWMDFLQTDSVMQSSTTQDEFIEFLEELHGRLLSEMAQLRSNRSELANILSSLNIDNNIN